ncbi:PSRP7 [Auxenochlorella protothecoides x Auxenochlorella symbiontica]
MQFTVKTPFVLVSRPVFLRQRVISRSTPTWRRCRPAATASFSAEAPTESSPADVSGGAAAPTAASPATSSPPQSARRYNQGYPSRGPKVQGPARTLAVTDLEVGKTYTGTVMAIIKIGAFINVGAKTDGLLHISQISTEYVSSVTDRLQVGQEVEVRVLTIEPDGLKFALTMIAEGAKPKPSHSPRRDPSAGGGARPGSDGGAARGAGGRQGSSSSYSGRGPTGAAPGGSGAAATVARKSSAGRDSGAPARRKLNVKVGDVLMGKIANVATFGAFVDVGDGTTGLLHYSEMKLPEGVTDVTSAFKPGQEVEVLITSLKPDKRGNRGSKIGLTMRSKTEVELDRKLKSGGLRTEGAGGAPEDAEEFHAMGQALKMAGLNLSLYPKAPSVSVDGGSEVPAADQLVSDDVLISDSGPAEESQSAASSPEAVSSPFVDSAPVVDDSPLTTKEEETVEELATAEVEAPSVVDNLDTSSLATDAIGSPAEDKPLDVAAAETAAPEEAPAAEQVPDGSPEGAHVPAAAEEEAAPPVSEAAAPEAASVGLASADSLVADMPEQAESAEQVSPLRAVQAAAQPEEASAPKVALSTGAGRENEGANPAATEAATPGAASLDAIKRLRGETGAGIMDCKQALQKNGGDEESAREWLRKKGLASAEKKAGRSATEGAIWSFVHGSKIGVLLEVNSETDFVARSDEFKDLAADLAMQVAACAGVDVVNLEDVPAAEIEREREIEMGKEDLLKKPEAIRGKMVDGRLQKYAASRALLEQPFIRNTDLSVAEHLKGVAAKLGENIQVRRFIRYNLGEGLVGRTNNLAAEVDAQVAAMSNASQSGKAAAPAPEAAAADGSSGSEAATAVTTISPQAIKELRAETGAGIMACKAALREANGDAQAASEALRKKGLASAEKKAGRAAAEGVIGAYIHSGNRTGVMVEVNCESDFVARGEAFSELVENIALQLVASGSVQYVSVADIPEEVRRREAEIEAAKEDLASKPEAIRSKIVAGRVDKLLTQQTLLHQTFIRDPTKTVEDVVKEHVSKLGENIQIRRFARFNLGEGLEKKTSDFAAEVAAQTGGKA